MLKYETDYHEKVLDFKSYSVFKRKKPFQAHDETMNFFIVFSGNTNMYSLHELINAKNSLPKRKKQILQSVTNHFI